jgi:WD40 repeat protein
MLNEDANSQIPIGFKLRHTLQRNKKSINSVAWSPDGEIFVCGSDEFNLLFWDAQVVKQWGKLFDEESFEESSEDLGDVRFICVAWSPDSQTLVGMALQQVQVGINKVERPL